MPKSYWTKIQTPNGLKYFRADEVTDELLQKIKDEVDNVFYVEYGTTTFADAEAAYLAGKTLVCREIGQTVQETRMDGLYFLIDYLATAGTYTGHFVFSNISGYAQENVVLTPSAHYEKISTTLTTREQVIATASAEIAQEYVELCHEYAADNKFPIPIGTVVTYIDNTSSDVLQYLYRSKVEIAGNEWASSSRLQAPANWDKVRVSDIFGKTFFATVFTTPYSEIKAAYDSGRSIIAVNGNTFYHMFDCNESAGYERFRFSLVQGNTFLLFTCNKTGYDATHGWNPQPDVGVCAYQGDIAPKYSSESTYDVGDLAYDGGLLYRCTTAISTPEIWNPNHWTRTDMDAELQRVESLSKIAVFYVDYILGQKVYPNPDEILDAIDSGKFVVIDQPNLGVWNHTEWLLEYAHQGKHDEIRFVNGPNTLIATRDNTVSEPVWQWNTGDSYDNALSSTSANAVQNKTLYSIIDDLQARVSALEGN